MATFLEKLNASTNRRRTWSILRDGRYMPGKGRAMKSQRAEAGRTPIVERQPLWLPKVWTFLAILALLSPYGVSFGSTGASFTLVNRTGYFLHAVVNNESIVYIPPDVAITRETNAQYVVVVELTYSPGQDRTGKVIRTFQTVVHTASTSSHTASDSNTCSNSGNSCESTTSSTGTSSTTIDPITWVVTADSLSSH